MQTSIFTVYDEKAKAHLTPFFMPNSEMAKRTFTDCINSTEHKFHHHPSDYTLFIHGHFEDNNAAFTLQSSPKSLGNGVEFLNPEQQEPPNAQKISDVSSIRHDAQG